MRLALEAENIEARPLWQPLHMQPLFSGCEVYGGAVSEALYADGLCLPSGSNLEPEQQRRVIAVIRREFGRA
jgi:pyridoxal phosphate-dependent aminotransferase EpsN